jgi:hypothetical protein
MSNNISLCLDCVNGLESDNKTPPKLDGYYLAMENTEPGFKSGKFGYPCDGCDTQLGGVFYDYKATKKESK